MQRGEFAVARLSLVPRFLGNWRDFVEPCAIKHKNAQCTGKMPALRHNAKFGLCSRFSRKDITAALIRKEDKHASAPKRAAQKSFVERHHESVRESCRSRSIWWRCDSWRLRPHMVEIRNCAESGKRSKHVMRGTVCRSERCVQFNCKAIGHHVPRLHGQNP